MAELKDKCALLFSFVANAKCALCFLVFFFGCVYGSDFLEFFVCVYLFGGGGGGGGQGEGGLGEGGLGG